jgi:GT2 family glycosyltransferase
MLTDYAVVVLTQGLRPDTLQRAVVSVLAQRDVTTDILVVGNGWEPADLPEGVRGLALPENVGIPAGRNAGVAATTAPMIFFLDDDAWLPEPDTLARISRMFADNPRFGLIQPRVTDPAATTDPTRWIPRMRKGDPRRSSAVFSCWEGAVAIPRDVFECAGGWPDPFFYAHEGIELAWRVWECHRIVWYAGDLVAHHPVIDPRRHDEYYRLNARNRVWLARRNLPWPVGVPYIASWTAVQRLRSRQDPQAWRAWWGGFEEGWRTDPGTRRPLSWSTVWEMARYGRPPVV